MFETGTKFTHLKVNTPYLTITERRIIITLRHTVRTCTQLTVLTRLFFRIRRPLGLGLDSALDMEVLKFSKVEGDELWVGLALEGVCSLGDCLVSPRELPLLRKLLFDFALDTLGWDTLTKVLMISLKFSSMWLREG